MMFRLNLRASLGLAILLLAASPAAAQFGPRMQLPASVQNVMLLRAEPVQKELALNPDQNTAIGDIAAQMQTEAMEIFSGLQDLSQDEQKAELPNIMKMMNEKGKELQAKVDKILDAKQTARLKELSLQRRGAAALEDEEVLAALKITPDQKKELLAVQEAAAAEAQKVITSGEDRNVIREKMQAVQKEASAKGLAILTEQQREAFEKMKGPKFEFPQGQRRGLF